MNGLGEDAMTLTRSMYEVTMIVLFILQKPHKQRQRAAMYHAWAAHQQMKMLNKWKNTPGLRRQATKKHFAMGQKLIDTWATKAGGVNVSSHWSGPGGLENATRTLREDRSYQTIYRYLSPYAHGADVAGAIEVGTDGRYVIDLLPNIKYTTEALELSQMVPWILAARINKQWGFGFKDRLDSLKPRGARAI